MVSVNGLSCFTSCCMTMLDSLAAYSDEREALSIKDLMSVSLRQLKFCIVHGIGNHHTFTFEVS